VVCAIEDAGFEIKDCIQWIYGSGFPKSHDISKAIDKKLGAEREVIGQKFVTNAAQGKGLGHGNLVGGKVRAGFIDITAPATPEAKQWEGWGTALKPANEPIVLARKPLSEKTVAENVLKWGTGGLNIDGCRIPTEDNLNGGAYAKNGTPRNDGWGMQRGGAGEYVQPTGRFPANVILDEEAGRMLDEQHKGASRFFYCAKASKKERNSDWRGNEISLTPKKLVEHTNKHNISALGRETVNRNNHPTVKPTDLMAWLVRLVTPPGGIVLDPFAGSGSTLVAAKREGFQYIGIEREAEYVEIAKERVG